MPLRVGIAALAFAAVLVSGETLYALKTSKEQPEPFLGTPVVPSRIVPQVPLVSDADQPVPFHDPLFRATFVFFGFAHCKDTCPVALAVLSKAYRTLDAPKDVRVEMVTVDPVRDNPKALEAFVHRYDRAFRGLTGDEKALAQLYSRFDVKVDARTRELVHGDAIYLVDDVGRIVAMYPPDVAPQTLAHDARILIGKP